MSDTGQVPELDELESIDVVGAPAAPTAPQGPQATPVAMYGGLPTPFYNPAASREYYRFLFGGVLILVGCLMPFGPEWDMAGYKTLTGGIMFVIALGIIWSMWGAINIGRMPSMKWLLLAFVPFVWGIFKLVGAFSEPAVNSFTASGGLVVKSWGELFSTLFDRDDPDRFLKCGNFFRYFGPGKLLVFFGAAIVELHFVLGILGGAKKNKQQKLEARSARAERRPR